MAALYEIATLYRKAAVELENLDLDDQVISDTLEGLGGDLEQKAVNVAFVVKNLEVTVGAIDGAIEEMKRQVRDSIGCIYQLYKKNPEVVPPLFSYPEGQEEDFNEDSVFYLRNYGVEVCPTAIPGLNNVVTTLPMRLYRCAPGLGGQPFPLD